MTRYGSNHIIMGLNLFKISINIEMKMTWNKVYASPFPHISWKQNLSLYSTNFTLDPHWFDSSFNLSNMSSSWMGTTGHSSYLYYVILTGINFYYLFSF